MKPSASLVETLRHLNPIVEVALEHVTLRSVGQQFVGRCPFHDDKSPSFYVHPAKEVFFCHGCKTGGDVFEFVRLYRRCSFRDSLQFLSSRCGICSSRLEPSPILSANIAALEARRESEKQFKRVSSERIDEINRTHRALGQAATNAETCLQTGNLDLPEQEIAWDALKSYRIFENRVEREGLADSIAFRAEWETTHGA